MPFIAGSQGYGGRNEAPGGDYGQPGPQQGQPNKGESTTNILFPLFPLFS